MMPRVLPVRHLLAAFCVVVFLLGVVVSPHRSILAQPARIPHENPAEAEDITDTISLMVFYGNVFSQGMVRRYDSANAMLDELKYARIPDALRNMAERYTALSHQLFDRLNNIERLLNEASELIRLNQIDRARQKLDEAETAVQDVQGGLRDIELVTTLMGERMGISSPQASNRLRETFQRLTDVLEELRRLVGALDLLRQELVENPENVKLSASFYYRTVLEVSAPKEGRPGTLITVTGNVSSRGDAIDREVGLLWDNVRVTGEVTRGQFRFEIFLPPQITTGRHTITVLVAPVERYSAASWAAPIEITRSDIVVEASAPSFNIMPEFKVTGQVRVLAEPLSNAVVTLDFKKSTTTVMTGADGRFVASLNVPFDPSLFGPEELLISVEPEEPYYLPGKVSRWIVIVNPVNSGIVLIALVSLGVLVLKRSLTRRGFPGGNLDAQDTFPLSPGAIPGLLSEHHLTDARASVLSAYRASVGALAKATGIPPVSNDTFREYASRIMTLVMTGEQPFTELTGIAEMALYSDCDIDSQAIARAELLARQVREFCIGTA